MKNVTITWSYFIPIAKLFRNSHWRCSIKKGALKNLEKFTGKQMCWSLFFNKVVGLMLRNMCFLVNFAKFSRTSFFIEHLRWLFLDSNTLQYCHKITESVKVKGNIGTIWIECLNYLSANPTKWSNTLKQFIGNSQLMAWVCLIILWGWHVKC